MDGFTACPGAGHPDPPKPIAMTSQPLYAINPPTYGNPPQP